MKTKPPLLYTLHTGELYGMERMSLATIEGLRDEFEPVIFTPPGPVAGEARKLGFSVVETAGLLDFAAGLRPYLARHERLAFFPTRTVHSIVFCALNAVYRRRVAHIHMVHGSANDAGIYGPKRILNFLPLTIVAVSEFVREQLVAYGVRKEKIVVIENFLTAQRVARAPRREAFVTRGVRRAAVLSRLIPPKRIDVLLACLEDTPALNAIAFHIYGTGSESDAWRSRASTKGLNVTFEGFRLDVAEQLATADLLVHLCPTEPFGLVILEAMAADVPVLAPDRGGAGSLIEAGVSGLHFKADDPASLADSLARLCEYEPERLNALVSGARTALDTRFSERERLADYRSLIWERLSTGLPARHNATAERDPIAL